MEKITKYTPRGNLLQVAYWAIQREIAMRKQHTFVYCQRCNFEMCSMNNATDNKDGTVCHICKNCGIESRWDYDAPVPLNIITLAILKGKGR